VALSAPSFRLFARDVDDESMISAFVCLRSLSNVLCASSSGAMGMMMLISLKRALGTKDIHY